MLGSLFADLAHELDLRLLVAVAQAVAGSVQGVSQELLALRAGPQLPAELLVAGEDAPSLALGHRLHLVADLGQVVVVLRLSPARRGEDDILVAGERLEDLHQGEALLVELSPLPVEDDLLVRLDSVVGLLQDRHQEVEQDHEHEEGLHEPEGPDADHVRAPPHRWLFGHDRRVAWEADLPDGRPESLDDDLLEISQSLQLIALCVDLHAENSEAEGEHEEEDQVTGDERHELYDADADDLDEDSVGLEDPQEEQKFDQSQNHEEALQLGNEEGAMVGSEVVEKQDDHEHEELHEVAAIPAPEVADAGLTHLDDLDGEEDDCWSGSHVEEAPVGLLVRCKERGADREGVEEHVDEKEDPQHLARLNPLIVHDFLDGFTLIEGRIVLTAPQEELGQVDVVESHLVIRLALSDGPDLVSHNQLGEVHVGMLNNMAFALGLAYGSLPLNDFLSQLDLLIVRAREAVAGDVLVFGVGEKRELGILEWQLDVALCLILATDGSRGRHSEELVGFDLVGADDAGQVLHDEVIVV